MRVVIGLSAALGLVMLTGLFYFRQDIVYYWKLWRVNQIGATFYEEYEHLARDIDFGGGDVRLDVYSPPQGENHPVLLFVHGGGWDSYEKEFFAPVAMKLVPRDMVVVIPDYTLHPDAGFEEMTRETAAAVAWTLENITEYGGNPGSLVLSGHSAGGHLAGLVAFESRWLDEVGHDPQELCGFLGMSGVYDVPMQMAFERSHGREAPVMTAVMGGEANFEKASPTTYASKGAPPTLLVHGAQDETVPLAISERLHTIQKEADLESELEIYPEKGHTDFLLEALTDDQALILSSIDRLIDRCRIES